MDLLLIIVLLLRQYSIEACLTDGWSPISTPETFSQIDTAPDGTTWAVTAGGNIYRRSGSSWTSVDGGLVQISVGSSSRICGVASNGNLYRWTGSGWSHEGGGVKWCAINAIRDTYALDKTNGDLWKTNYCSSCPYQGTWWSKLDGSTIPLNAVAVANYEIIGLQWFGAAVDWGGTYYGWSYVAGVDPGGYSPYFKSLTVSTAGSIWGTDKDDNRVWHKVGSKWVEHCTRMKQISIGSDNLLLWGIDPAGKVHKWEETPSTRTIQAEPDVNRVVKTLLLSHKDTNAGYFATDFPSNGIENEDNPDANTYSIIGGITENHLHKYQQSDGSYQFTLDYTTTSNAKFHIEWAQNSWITEEVIDGYVPLIMPSQSGTDACKLFHGIGISQVSTVQYLDGTNSCHWNSIGALSHAETVSGFRCFNGQYCNSVELNAIVANDPSRFLCDLSVKYVTFNGLECINADNECTIYQSQDVSRVIRTGTGQYKVYWYTPFTDNKYAIFTSSNTRSPTSKNGYGWSVLAKSSASADSTDRYYTNVQTLVIGSTAYTWRDSNFISITATSNFFDMSMATFSADSIYSHSPDYSIHSSNNIKSIKFNSGLSDYYQISYNEALTDDKYPIGLTSNSNQNPFRAMTGIHGNNINGDHYEGISANSVKLESRVLSDLDNAAPWADSISFVAGYPDIDADGFNIKYVTFNGETKAIYSSFGVSRIDQSGQIYKITWDTPFTSSDYAVILASNYLGTWANQAVINGAVNREDMTIATIALSNVNDGHKSDYISVIAFEKIANQSCVIPQILQRPLCFDAYSMNLENGILSQTALDNGIFFFSVEANLDTHGHLLGGPQDLVTIQIHSFNDINYASYLELNIYTESSDVTTRRTVEGYGCGAQAKNLGQFNTPDLCAIAAYQSPSCPGLEFMWSSYISWGCRCCEQNSGYSADGNWHIYEIEINPKIEVLRVNPGEESKFVLTHQNISLMSSNVYSFWLQYSNVEHAKQGFIAFGVGDDNSIENEVLRIPFRDFVDGNNASFRSSYESFKYIKVGYNGADVEHDMDRIHWLLHYDCGNGDELNKEYVKQFGFSSSHSGTDGTVSIHVYTQTDIYSCVLSNIDANTDSVCTNLHYVRYERCSDDIFRQYMSTNEFDYILDMRVDNNDYLIIDKLIFEEYFIALDQEITLTNVNNNYENRAIVAFRLIDAVMDENTKVSTINGETVENGLWVTTLDAFDVSFGVGLTEIKGSEITLQLYDDDSRYICSFTPPFVPMNEGETFNYLCVDNLQSGQDAQYNYIKYHQSSCIANHHANKMKIAVDSPNNIEINNVFINDNSFNSFCTDTASLQCSAPNDELLPNDECEYLTDCMNIGIASIAQPFVKPITIISNIYDSTENAVLTVDSYDSLYSISITTCNSPAHDTTLAAFLRGFSGSSQRNTFTNLPSKASKTYYIGATNIGTFVSIQFEVDAADTSLCLSHVLVKETATNNVLFESDMDTIGKGVYVETECSTQTKELQNDIYVPCYSKLFLLEINSDRLHTTLTMELCSGDTDVGLTVANQDGLGVVLTGVTDNGVFATSESVAISSDKDWSFTEIGNIREYNLLTEDFLGKSISVVFVGNQKQDPICIDKVSINNQQATLNTFWIGLEGCTNNRPCLPAIPAVLSWPICGIEVIGSRTVLNSKTVEDGDTLSASCSNLNRFSSIECSAEKSYAYDYSQEWSNEISRADSETIEIAAGYEDESHWEVGLEVQMGPEQFQVTASGSYGQSHTDTYSKTTSTGVEITTSSGGSISMTDSDSFSCSSALELGPFQSVNYDIIKAVAVSEYQTYTDFKMTKCSYILDKDDTNPAHFMYIRDIPGVVTLKESLSCDIKFWGTEFIQQPSQCNEAQKINAIELNTYVPFCNATDNTLWDPCQCETGDALTDQTCFCVNPKSGMLSDDFKATATDNSVTTWKTWCYVNCPGTQFRNDTPLSDINGNPILDIIAAGNIDEGVSNIDDNGMGINIDGNKDKDKPTINNYNYNYYSNPSNADNDYNIKIIALCIFGGMSVSMTILYLVNTIIKAKNSKGYQYQMVPQYDTEKELHV